MKPFALGSGELHPRRKTQAELAAELAAARPRATFKGQVLPETQVQACPRVKVADLPVGHLKQKHIEHLEQNQKIASCCRHPENHEVEALKSHPNEAFPDIYIFHCNCGRKHRFFCVGNTDPDRPFWDAA